MIKRLAGIIFVLGGYALVALGIYRIVKDA